MKVCNTTLFSSGTALVRIIRTVKSRILTRIFKCVKMRHFIGIKETCTQLGFPFPHVALSGCVYLFLNNSLILRVCVCACVYVVFCRLQTHISRLPPGTVPGQCLAIEGGVCRLSVVE